MICFEPFTAPSQSGGRVCCPWRCRHAFHEHCVRPWVVALPGTQPRSCPTCRCTERWPHPVIPATHVQFVRHPTGVVVHQLGPVGDSPVTLDRYTRRWDNRPCLAAPHRRHIVTWTKPYAVVGRCSCGERQAFCYDG